MRTVLLCIPMLNNAGAQRFVAELAMNLDKTKYKAVVVTTRKSLPDSDFHRLLLENGIEIRDVCGGSYLDQMKKMIALLKEYDPDIVHSNIGSALHVLAPVWMRGKKTVHIFTAHSMGYRIFSGARQKVMKFAFKTRRIIPVAICDTVKKSLCETYGLAEDRVPCVYNGVDTAAFVPKDGYCEGGTVHFVSVGTLYDLKNHSMLIEAFGQLKQRMDGVKLTIVGGGELFDSLQAQVKTLGLENDVALVGDRPNVSDYLRAADVYCCPSRVEGLPISVLEAMSTGLPVVTTPAGGVVDIVHDGVNGYVVPHGDASAMAERMAALAEDRALLETMGRASRREALRYDIALCAEGYEKLYDKSKVLN